MTRSSLDPVRLAELADRLRVTDPNSEPRRQFAGEVLEYLVQSNAVAAWARTAPGGLFGNALLDRDELEQIIAAEVLATLIRSPHFSGVREWAGWLYWKAKHAMRAQAQASAYTVASGMTTVLRRQARIRTVTEDLERTLGREPTNQEVIAHANANREESARRHGTLITEADFTQRHIGVPVDTDHNDTGTHAGGFRQLHLSDGADPADTAEENIAATALAWRLQHEVALRTIASTPELLDDVRRVGERWIQSVQLDGEAPKANELAADLGWSARRARIALTTWSNNVKEVAHSGKLDWLRLYRTADG